ncbi:MAG: alanine racemase [Chloroflexi bacterium]|nr:alanine racemase [Chloroflexota bacterium]
MIYLSDILAATGGKVHGPLFAQEFPDFCYDSRILNPGELFLAVKTEKGDGHDYIEAACRDGATGVMCQLPLDLSHYRVTCVVVPDTQEALRQWARYIISKYHPQVIGVTGSNGKTTAKEAIATVLEGRFPVFRNHANYNDRYGLPIALGRLTPQSQVAVLEMACDSFHEIEELAALTSPRIGVVMSVGPVHLEFLGSLENIAQEKGKLVEALPENGWAVLNFDDPRVREMARRTKARLLTFGTASEADLWASDVEISGRGTRFLFHSPQGEAPVHLRLLGRHNIYPAMGAMGIGILYGIDPRESAERLSSLLPIPGRLNPLPGINGSLLLDDSYSANPSACMAALDLLRNIKSEQKIAVLGDMTQLGSFEEEGHRQVGEKVAQSVHFLVVKGDRARIIASQARHVGMKEEQVYLAYSDEDAFRAVAERVGPEDVVLVKGSLEARMERLAEMFLADPDTAERVLVRQDPAWKKIHILASDRPTWVQIDLGAIANNLREIKRRVGEGVGILATIKADAYGHGAVKVARALLANGASMLGVATLSEALVLRKAEITAPVIVLGYTPAWQARTAVLNKVTTTVFSLDVARALSRAAVALNSQVKVHIKIDTGLGRLGLLPQEALDFVRQIRNLRNLIIEGIFTHFAVADDPHARSTPGWGREYTAQQLQTFTAIIQQLEKEGIKIPLVHAANSAAIFTLPDSHFNMVRPGIAIYGLDPSPQVPCPPGFRPTMTFKTQIAQVKELPARSYIGYGSTYSTERPMRIAVLPVGYGDGFRRGPQNWGEVLVRGKRAPVVGRVSMDQSTIDVTHIPEARQGDEVVLIGEQGGERITAEEVAERLGTINYEVVSEILARVPRVH